LKHPRKNLFDNKPKVPPSVKFLFENGKQTLDIENSGIFCVSYIYSTCIDRNGAFISSHEEDFVHERLSPKFRGHQVLHKFKIAQSGNNMGREVQAKISVCSII